MLALVLFIVFLPQTVFATVYWASPTGNNSAVCTSIDSATDVAGDDPGSYGTIRRAKVCATAAGDKINIKAGTYTGVNNRIWTTDDAGAGLANGTSESVRTIVQGAPGEATPLINMDLWVYIDDNDATSRRNYITFKNLSIDGSTNTTSAGGGTMDLEGAYITVDNVTFANAYDHAIVSFTSGVSATNHHLTIKNSTFSGYGRDGNGYAVYSHASYTTFENNTISSGRGGGLQIYSSTFNSDNPTVRNNYIHGILLATQAGYTSQCFGIITDGANAQIYRNIVDMSSCTTGTATGGIEVSQSATIHHNIVYGGADTGVEVGKYVQLSGTSYVSNNIIVGNAGGNLVNRNNSTIVANTNKTTGSLTDCTVSTSNFTHKAGSSCIDAGTALVGYNYNGSAPDQGPFEVFVFSTCSVANATASVINATFSNNVAPPLLPSTGVTTFTARKATVNDVVTGVVRTGDNQLDITVTDAFVAGNAIDISWASGNLTDSALIGGTLNQPYRQGLTNQACTNNVGGAPSHLFIQARFEFHGLRGTEAAPVILPYSSAAENTNINVVVGGKARLRIAITCSTADCPATGFYPFYACASCTTAGTYTLIPDTFATDEDIALCGTSSDPDIPTSGDPTTDQLSTAGTFVAGALVRTSNAIPTVDLAQNNKTELEYCIAWDTDAVADRVYTFKVYKQDSTAIDTYTVVPQATIRAISAGLGF